MMATGRLGLWDNIQAALRRVSLFVGLNLIIGGIIILLFPQILVLFISMMFIISGVVVILNGRKRKKINVGYDPYWRE